MNRHTFLITGCGRSGTKFLARELSRSFLYEVCQEPNTSILDVQHRFDRNYYGEVNGFLVTQLASIRVTRKLIILRDPYDIFLSYLRAGHGYEIQFYILSTICLLDSYIKANVAPWVRFNDMVSSKDVVLDIARCVGILDIEEDEISMEPENAIRKIAVASPRDLVVPYVARVFDEFNAIYFPKTTEHEECTTNDLEKPSCI